MSPPPPRSDEAVDTDRLALLAERIRPQVLAKDEILPITPRLATALDLPGFRRGSTVLLEGRRGFGTTSLALALLAEATELGKWCVALGLPDLGLVAANEAGVALDRLVLVPAPQRRAASILAAFLEVVEVALLPLSLGLSGAERRSLSARARQRGVVLVLLGEEHRNEPAWPEVPEVSLHVLAAPFIGIGTGEGRITARRLVLERSERRKGTARARAEVWIPEPATSSSDLLAAADLLQPIVLDELPEAAASS